MSTAHIPQRDDSRATDRRGLRVLGWEECLTRLAHARMGRVAFTSDGETVILPVNHVVDGTGVAFRTTWGSKLQLAADGGHIAFEIDDHDPATATGWSVLIQGVAGIIDDPDAEERLAGMSGAPWLPVDTDTSWVRIRPDTVTGREIIPT